MDVAPSFFWHDYETFGTNPRCAGPSQFAGVRTDPDLNPVEDPVMFYCQPAVDMWPSPDACVLTGITPQLCLEKGLPEYQFAKAVVQQLGRPGTCGVGYNSIRFDDEFTRQLLYRNFYDPYEREYKSNNSRWDLIDVLRMARALRPEGIEWPVDADGRPTLRLEALTTANHIDHTAAHDALSDVYATLGMARLLRDRQPDLFKYAFSLRQKKVVADLLCLQLYKPLLHVSGKLDWRHSYATVVMPCARHPTNSNSVIVFDLMQDPAPLLALPAGEIRRLVFTAKDKLVAGEERIALKEIHCNKSPMLAPVAMLDAQTESRLGLDRSRCEKHWQQLLPAMPELGRKLQDVFAAPEREPVADPEFCLYAGFFDERDRRVMQHVRQADAAVLAQSSFSFHDRRLPEMLFRYRGRNFPESLNAAEREQWHESCQQRLHEKISAEWITRAEYHSRIHALLESDSITGQQRETLLQLQQWEQHLTGS